MEEIGHILDLLLRTAVGSSDTEQTGWITYLDVQYIPYGLTAVYMKRLIWCVNIGPIRGVGFLRF